MLVTEQPPPPTGMRQLWYIAPHAGAHRGAARVAISMAGPVVTLAAIGRTEWILYATFGAFCSLYGRNENYRARLRMQAGAALTLIAGTIVGVLVSISPQRHNLVIPAAALVGGAVQAISYRWRRYPPGPVFQIFGLCACASVPSTIGRLPIALAVAVAAAVFALLVGVAGQWLPANREKAAEPERRGPPPPWDLTSAAEMTVVIAIAGLVPTLTGIGHPYWAMIAASAALTRTGRSDRLIRAAHRAIGTIGGVGLAALVLFAQPPIWVLVVAVLLAQFGTELFMDRNYALALLFLTPMALCMMQLTYPTDPSVLLTDRALETVVGSVIAAAAALLIRRRDV